MTKTTRRSTRSTLPALLVAGLFLAGTTLPAVAETAATQAGAEPQLTRAPYKTGNRFHHRNVTRETAEFARLEVAEGDAAQNRSRRAPHKAANRFQQVD